MTKIIDISATLSSNATVYPDDDRPVLRAVREIGVDSLYSLTQIENMTTHLLTHVDLPAHFLRDGVTLDDVPLERFQGRATVVEVDGPRVLPEHLPAEIGGLNILFRTPNSFIAENEPFHSDHTYLTDEAAAILAQRGANLVGIDYLSVDAGTSETFGAHLILLSAGVLILEGLRLAEVRPGTDYHLWALPLKVSAGDGAPARAVLVTDADG